MGWLDSWFHFSFAEYYNPTNIEYGVLRVLNDDLIQPGTGFDMHPHENMEIITYVVDGELTHGDSIGNKRTLVRGEVQYMSAGTGVIHSEHNMGYKPLRLLQIWIYPDQKGYTPQYGDFRFGWEERGGKWLRIVSGISGSAPIKIHQDIDIFTAEVDAGKELSYPIAKGRQAYLVQIEGISVINGLQLKERDALEAVGESLKIVSSMKSHFILLDMDKER